MLEEHDVLAALRGDRSVEDVCRVAGITVEELAEARQAELRRRLPPSSARLNAAVGGTVEILRDRAGIPHVYASATPDLYFGLGFAQAQDRLWQIDRLRRRALGRQAEVLGRDYLKSDVAHRTVGIDLVAGAEVERIDERTHQIVEAFAAGINRQIEACGRNLPIEFAILGYEPEPFTARDVVAILRGMWWSLNGRIENIVVAEAARELPTEELREAFLTPEAPEQRIVPPGSPYPEPGLPLDPVRPSLAAMGMGDTTGSNNWAIAGSRAASGKAILCGDPHQPFWIPSSWYEYGVHGPEDDAAGAGHPGVPGLWWGSNGTIAWAITNNAASTRDLYREQPDPGDPTRYRDGDAWRPFDVRPVEIAVKGQGIHRFELRSTVRGPIVNHLVPSLDEGGDPPLSLRWVGTEHLDDVRALVAIGRARNWPSFREALRDWSVAVFNFVYADREGKVGYQCAGRVPVRGRAVRGFRDAADSRDAWQGYVPFDALPRMEDPPRGYVTSANQRVAPDDYPYPLHGAWGGGHRAARIQQALEGAGPFTRDAAISLQNDVKGARAERLVPKLLARIEAVDDPEVRLARRLLGAWDYRYTLDSPAPAVFEACMHAWQEHVAAARFPARLVPLVRGSGGVAARLLERDDVPWFEGDSTPMLVAAVRSGVALLRSRFGDDPSAWRWDAVHRAHWRHPLSNDATAPAFDVGPAPVDGSGDTVRNTGAGSPPYAAASGAEYRMVVDFSEPTRFLAVQNVGNSGQPGSPHYADQFGPWVAGTYHTVALEREDVERDLEGTTVLEP